MEKENDKHMCVFSIGGTYIQIRQRGIFILPKYILMYKLYNMSMLDVMYVRTNVPTYKHYI